MIEYIRKARERCWKIYNQYYREDKYKHHEARYREEITQYLGPGTRLLDAGCGAKLTFTHEFAAGTSVAVGIDVGELKPITGEYPYAVRGDLHSLPFKDCSFDIVISMSVLEHLSNPEKAFREFARILKPAGVVIIQTPNKYDYVSLVAKMTPFWFHRWILLHLLGRKEEDTFPTFFRANTRRQILFLLNQSGLVPAKIMLFNQYPAYLMFSPFLFRLGVYYEQLLSRYDFLAQLRGWILLVAKKGNNGRDCSPELG